MDNQIDPKDVLAEVRILDPRLLELAAVRVLNKKLVERIGILEKSQSKLDPDSN